MRDTKDELLLARLQAGDETALRDLAEAYGSKITSWRSGTSATRKTRKR